MGFLGTHAGLPTGLLLFLVTTACDRWDDGPPDVFLETNGRVAFDFDDDGYADIAQATFGSVEPGPTYRVWFGGPEGLSESARIDLQVPDPADEDSLLPDVHWIGDVNDDGYADLARSDVEVGGERNLIVWYGGERSAIGTGISLATGIDPSTQYTHGCDAIRAGDLNGDGVDDLLWITGPDTLAQHWGGAAGLAVTPDVVWKVNDEPGTTSLAPPAWWDLGPQVDYVFPLGDVDSDGYSDVQVGFRLLRGGPNGLQSSEDIPWTTGTTEESMPWEFTGGWGDANGDGHVDAIRERNIYDVAEGAPEEGRYLPESALYFGTGSGPGEAPVYLLSTTMLDFSETPGDRYPHTESTIGPDVNGDGVDDVLVLHGPLENASEVPVTYTSDGRPNAYLALWFGRDGVGEYGSWEWADVVIPPPFEEDETFTNLVFPFEGGIAGDLNGDGFADAIAEHQRTSLYVWFGGREGFREEPQQCILDFGRGWIGFTGP